MPAPLIRGKLFRTRKTRSVLPKQHLPKLIGLAYYDTLRRVVLAPLRLAVRHGFAREGLRLDSLPSDLVDGIESEFFDQLSLQKLRSIAETFSARVDTWQRQQLAHTLKQGLGVEPIASEPHLARTLQAFTTENVKLIKSIPERFFGELRGLLADGDLSTRPEQLADEIEERFGVSESRAALIARDQVGKLYGNLNQARQEDLGITSFIWRSVKDNRVRESHEHLEGREYNWDEPPDEETGEPSADGVTPGDPVNCRCYAEPVLEGLLPED